MTEYDDYNPLINLDEDSSVSAGDNKKKRNEMMKKKRRSRITINDNTEAVEIKREYYDAETKLKKSTQSATAFNRYINSDRVKIQKHFLKRKVKAALEREHLDKSKCFFNVLFYPNMAMFNPPSQQVSQPINPMQKQAIPMAKPILMERPPEIKKNIPVFTSDSKNSEIKPELQYIAPKQILNQPSLYITPEPIIKPLEPEKKIDQTPVTEDKKVKPLTEISRRDTMYKILCEQYMNNPEKIKNELSPHDLHKLQMFIRKNLTQQSNMDQINLQILRNNLNGAPVPMNLKPQNTQPQPRSNILTIPFNFDNN
jgi:hypothetical protein